MIIHSHDIDFMKTTEKWSILISPRKYIVYEDFIKRGILTQKNEDDSSEKTTTEKKKSEKKTEKKPENKSDKK